MGEAEVVQVQAALNHLGQLVAKLNDRLDVMEKRLAAVEGTRNVDTLEVSRLRETVMALWDDLGGAGEVKSEPAKQGLPGAAKSKK